MPLNFKQMKSEFNSDVVLELIKKHNRDEETILEEICSQYCTIGTGIGPVCWHCGAIEVIEDLVE
jgi:hypothetical protein